jgi:hypothetical protein
MWIMKKIHFMFMTLYLQFKDLSFLLWLHHALGVVTYQLHFFLQQFPPPLPILLGVYRLDCVGAAKRIQLLSCQTYWLKKHLAHEWC